MQNLNKNLIACSTFSRSNYNNNTLPAAAATIILTESIRGAYCILKWTCFIHVRDRIFKRLRFVCDEGVELLIWIFSTIQRKKTTNWLLAVHTAGEIFKIAYWVEDLLNKPEIYHIDFEIYLFLHIIHIGSLCICRLLLCDFLCILFFVLQSL